MMKKKKVFLIFLSLLVLWGIGVLWENDNKRINDVQATGEAVVCPCSSWTEDQFIRYEYRCEREGCGEKNILRREYRRQRACWSGACCPSGCSEWTHYHTSPIVYINVREWARCDPGQTDWQAAEIRWGCQGECLEAPQNGQPNRGNIDLPALFTWNNVPGFRDVLNRGPMSYRKIIDNTNTDAEYVFDFHHDFLGEGGLPLFRSLPNLDLLKGDPTDGRFVQVNGRYRFIRPTPHQKNRITSCFGYRVHPLLRRKEMHNGVDIGHGGLCPSPDPEARCLIPIYAVAPGRITTVNPRFGGGGQAVVIDHSSYNFDHIIDDTRIETRYLHLSDFSSGQHGQIREGDRVTSEGQIRGLRRAGDLYDHDNDPNTEKRRRLIDVIVVDSNIIGFMGTTGRSTGVHLHFEIRKNGKAVNPLSLITVPAVPNQASWQLSGRNCPQPLGGTASLRHFLATYIAEEEDDQSKFYPAVPPFSYRDRGKGETSTSTMILLGNRFSAENCLLRPSDTYNWAVQACCNFDGTNCGPTNRWTMSTSDQIEKLYQGTATGSEIDPEMIYRLEDADIRWCEKRIEIDGLKTRPDRYEIMVQQRLPRFRLWGLGLFERFECHPLLLDRDGKCQPIIRSALLPGQSPLTHLENEESLLFTKSDYAHYRWQVRVCEGAECGEYTPWRYLKISEEVTVSPPVLIFPSDDPAGQQSINWPIHFRWNVPVGANSYQFQLYEGNKKILDTIVESAPGVGGQITRVAEITIPREKVELKIDTAYRWRVRSCWDTKGRDGFCEEEWSERHFRTTGRPPLLNYPANQAIDVLIPLTLIWEKIPGARSYLLTLNEREIIVQANRINLGFPSITQNTLYQWSVRSCNDKAGQICGERSIVHSFRTISLDLPQNLKPPTTDFFRGRDQMVTLSWDSVLGAHYYHLSVLCGEESVFSDIVQATQMDIPLTCFGPHLWSVRACLDENCQEMGEVSQGNFTLHPGAIRGVGFVPCGLDYNNPNTPWNETKDCQLNHLFIMLKIILDFLFWQLMPLVVAVMAIISGVLFYTSLGDPSVITRVKSIWQSVGKGLAIMFLGWTFVSIIMTIMGYTGIFGPWWQISF